MLVVRANGTKRTAELTTASAVITYISPIDLSEITVSPMKVSIFGFRVRGFAQNETYSV